MMCHLTPDKVSPVLSCDLGEADPRLGMISRIIPICQAHSDYLSSVLDVLNDLNQYDWNAPGARGL